MTGRAEAHARYRDALAAAGDDAAQQSAVLRELARRDLFFLLTRVLGRGDCDIDFVFARCREVQARPDGCLDLWARGHYKSTVITYALSIFDILNDPDITIGIFSHTRPIAKAFLRQIKVEFETNDTLRHLFPDVLWTRPRREAPKWSEDDGLVVRRTSNPKEATVEAWGLVDSMPTSKHFRVLVFDDVVTLASVSTPEMIHKTTNAWALALNLGAARAKVRTIGTRYHYQDSYRAMIDRQAVTVRAHPARRGGDPDGPPVLMTEAVLQKKRRDMGPFVFASQMLLDPKAEGGTGFRRDWIRTYPANTAPRCNTYILVDPANQKKPGSDYTAMVVWGLGPDGNHYLLDGVRDRLSLGERADRLFALHARHRPVRVGYEQYGLQADIAHMQDRMRRERYRFEIVPLGGRLSKQDRILRLVPLFEQGRIYLPETLVKADHQGRPRDLVEDLVEQELVPFPYGRHDDMLDAMARLLDPEFSTAWPRRGPARPVVGTGDRFF